MLDLTKVLLTTLDVPDELDTNISTDAEFMSDWRDFMKASIFSDSDERAESSTEADVKETEKFTQLVKKHSHTNDPDAMQDMNSRMRHDKLVKLVENSVQDLRTFSQRNLEHISAAGPDVVRPEFIFGSPYDQFISGKPAEGFRLFSIADQRQKILDWLTDLINLLYLIGKFNPGCLPAISLNFLMTKICSAEAHAQFICKNLANVFMSDDYWKAARHLKDNMPVNLVVDLLTLYCTDATLWYSSGKREWDQSCLSKKVPQDIRTLKQVILLLTDSYSALRKLLYLSRPTVLQSNLDMLKSIKPFISQEAVKVARSLIPEQTAQDITQATVLDDGLTELAVFVMSKDYEDFSALVSNIISSRVSPIDINIDLLCKCIKTFTFALGHDPLASKLIGKFTIVDSFIDIINYMVVWAAHLVRFNTVWELRYQSKVEDFLDKNTPALSGEAINPVRILKVVATAWRDKEKDLAEKKARAIKEAEAKEREAKLKEERELREMKERLELDRKSKLQQEGFQLASDSGRYEKWFKDNTCRIFFKTTSPEEKKGVLVGLEELGISASKVRNIKNPAGIIRTITIGEDEIYSDSLIESALHKAARFKPEGPVFNTEVVSAAFDLVFDKTFFELEWLDKAIVRAMDDKVSIQDARYCTKVMRDRGIIGQIKGKKNGPKIFALTPEGYSLYQIQKDYPNLPILAVPWEKYIGEEVAERLGTLQYFDINTRPVKDIDKMIAGKTPRFLDKYYVTAI